MTFVDRAEACAALKATLLAAQPQLPAFAAYMTHGDPKRPRAIELFRQRSPKTKHHPVAIFQYDDAAAGFVLLYPARPPREWAANVQAGRAA